ncbi:protein myomaker isoform X2 [Stigmatopora argus]
MGAYIAKMLLPTISSVVFLPAASVAAKRGFHMEAMVYFFTMFFSMIFHACEGPGLAILCFMKYDILEYFNVYGTALSMWVTLIAVGDFEEPQRSSITMFGVLSIAVRIYQDRWGYGIYSVPIGSAVFIITVKWLQKMKELRAVYPDKHVYTQQVGPGCCFGALALMLRFYFEEWDYAYVHSFYHLSLSLSFVLLLPKKNRYAGSGRNAAKLSCWMLCCCSMSLTSQKEKKNTPENKGTPEIKVTSKGKGATEKTTTLEKKDITKKEKKLSVCRSLLNAFGVSKKTSTLPIFSPPPATPVNGTSISKLKEMNGWK